MMVKWTMLTRAALATMAVASLAMSAPAAAQPVVTAASPSAPTRVGATSLDVGFQVEGQASSVSVTAAGRSATVGAFAAVGPVVVVPDRASGVTFHLLIPLDKPFPADGVLEISARAIAGDGSYTAADPVPED